MAKDTLYLGFEVKKKGKGLFVDCATVLWVKSRKAAERDLREYAGMNPTAVLTQKEANQMLERLKFLLAPKTWNKKKEKRLLEMLKQSALRKAGKFHNHPGSRLPVSFSSRKENR